MKTDNKNIVHKLIIGSQREQMVDQGFFDGRFVVRIQETKKIYKRKEKHKKNYLVD